MAIGCEVGLSYWLSAVIQNVVNPSVVYFVGHSLPLHVPYREQLFILLKNDVQFSSSFTCNRTWPEIIVQPRQI